MIIASTEAMMMYTRLFFVITLLLLLTGITRPVLAITDQEREILHRLYKEIKAAREIVDAAEKAVESDDRIQVDYQKLRNDLDKILEGIDDVEKIKRREPRELTPVSGKYR